MPAALVAAGTVLALLTPPAAAGTGTTIPACDRAGPCVVVEVVDGTQRVGALQYLYADEITGRADIQRASYPISGGTDAVVEPGSSLSRLLQVAGVDLGEVTYAEVIWPDLYRRHLLSKDEVRPGGFPGGLQPAFYSTDPTRWNYVRPQRSPQDANGAPGPDQGTYTTEPGGAFLVRVHLSGALLQVGVSATPVDGSDRRFTLSTDQSGPGLGYDWVLPDGSRSTEAAPQYAFADSALAGSYPISVGVEAPDGSFGWGTTSLRAGPAPSAPPTPAPTPTGTGGDGPADEGPTSHPQATLTAEPNANPSGSTGPSTPPTTAPTTAPQPSATGPAVPSAPPSSAPTPSPTPQPSGDEVSGVLLVSAQAPAAGGAQADPPRISPAARPLGAAPVTVPAALLAALAGLALLGLGAASESGALRRLLARRKR